MRSDHHDDQLGIDREQPVEPGEALGSIGRPAREIGVEQDDIGRASGNRRNRLVGRARRDDLGEQPAQQQPQQQPPQLRRKTVGR